MTLLGDPLRIKQILINLFDNALKFTERGSITLRAGVLTETADDLSFSIAITDTGKGIPAEAQARDFLALRTGRTARPPASTAAPGSAWPSSRQLSRLMHGDITVSSTPGDEGRTFTLTACLAENGSPAGAGGGHQPGRPGANGAQAPAAGRG